jgi:hypothetical protein
MHSRHYLAADIQRYDGAQLALLNVRPACSGSAGKAARVRRAAARAVGRLAVAESPVVFLGFCLAIAPIACMDAQCRERLSAHMPAPRTIRGDRWRRRCSPASALALAFEGVASFLSRSTAAPAGSHISTCCIARR